MNKHTSISTHKLTFQHTHSHMGIHTYYQITLRPWRLRVSACKCCTRLKAMPAFRQTSSDICSCDQGTMHLPAVCWVTADSGRIRIQPTCARNQRDQFCNTLNGCHDLNSKLYRVCSNQLRTTIKGIKIVTPNYYKPNIFPWESCRCVTTAQWNIIILTFFIDRHIWAINIKQLNRLLFGLDAYNNLLGHKSE